MIHRYEELATANWLTRNQFGLVGVVIIPGYQTEDQPVTLVFTSLFIYLLLLVR